MPEFESVSSREPARTCSEAATTPTALFSRTSTVNPLGKTCLMTCGSCAAARPATSVSASNVEASATATRVIGPEE